MTKRTFDIVFALVGLIVTAPVSLVLAAVVRLTSPGPVLYRGVRAGLGGKPFLMLKFRSMVQNAETIGGPSTPADDRRLTAVGRFMRKYKLDEFPQLLNVLAGQMSFVGPRPEIISEVEMYTAEQRAVLDVRPGITDWASIWNSNEESVLAGAPDPHKAYQELIQPTKLQLQLMYRSEHSFLIDIEILVSTFIKLLRPDWVPARLKPYGRPVAARAAMTTGHSVSK